MGYDSQPVSDSRERIFEYVVAYKREYDGNAPTLREIAERCCLSSATVRYHLLVLEKEGRIRWHGGRKIEIVGGHWQFAQTL
jgi:predicted ArsR family transcriptional regulator